MSNPPEVTAAHMLRLGLGAIAFGLWQHSWEAGIAFFCLLATLNK